MGYAATTGFIIYWKIYQTLLINTAHRVWFEEYNYCISIVDNNIQVSLLLKQYSETIIHNSYLLNLISCEPDLKSTQLSNTTILTFEIELPPSGKKIGFNLLDDEDFTIPYVTDTI